MNMRVATEFKPTHFTDGQIKIKVNVEPEYFTLKSLAHGICAMDSITRSPWVDDDSELATDDITRSRWDDGGEALATPDEIKAINRILRMTKKQFKKDIRWVAARCAYGDCDWMHEYPINGDVLQRMEKVILPHFPSFAHAFNSPEAV